MMGIRGRFMYRPVYAPDGDMWAIHVSPGLRAGWGYVGDSCIARFTHRIGICDGGP